MARRQKEKKLDSNGENIGSKILSVFAVILIIFIWLAIFAAWIRFDVGGFGNGVLRPVLKDIPVLNKILPTPTDEQLQQEAEESLDDNEIATLTQAKEMIEQLQSENDKLSKNNKELEEKNGDLSKEIERLRVFMEKMLRMPIHILSGMKVLMQIMQK